MAAFIKTLQDASRENIIYPRTKSEAVYRDDNTTSVEETLVNLESEVASIIENTSGLSGVYETKEDASAKLAEAKTYTDEQIAGHVHSWNDLNDKPFGEGEKILVEDKLIYSKNDLNNILDTDGIAIESSGISEVMHNYWDFYYDNNYKYYGVAYDRENEGVELGIQYGSSAPCVVVFNGVRYETTIQSLSGGEENGTLADHETMIIGGGNLPFVMVWSWDNKIFYKNLWVYGSEYNSSCSFEIYSVKEENGIKKIDPKYLPDNYTTQEYVDEQIATHTHSWNDLEDKPFYSVINNDWYGDTIIENVTTTVDENGYKMLYGDEYGFEMVMPFYIGDYLVYTVSGYVYDEEEEEEVYTTMLYPSIGAAYDDGQATFSRKARADFNVDGRIVSIVVYNGAGYATLIELHGFEPNSEVSFGLYHAAVEYHKIDSHYLPDDIAYTYYVDEQLATKSDSDHNHDDTYDTKGAADSALDAAKEYADEAVANLLNNSTEAVDSIYELRDAMQENAGAIEALVEISGSKADKEHTHSWNDLEDKPFGENEELYTDGPQTIEFTPYGDNGVYVAQYPMGRLGSLTEECIIEIDGVMYRGKYDDFANNEITQGVAPSDVSIPVGFTVNYAGSYIFEYTVYYYGDGNSHEVALWTIINGITTIDPKYLPEDYATTEYVDSQLATKADKEHAHAIADVTGLQDALDAKATQTGLDSLTEVVNGKAASVHTHAISEVTNLQTTLDAKATQANLDSHTGDTVKHITADERTAWNAIEGKAKTYTDEQVATKADSEHNHHSLYYTEAEIDGFIANINQTHSADISAIQESLDEIQAITSDEIRALFA